jgi:hypothetical protein
MWRVVMIGSTTGLEYPYDITAPFNAPRAQVEMAAYFLHGDLKKAGVVTEDVELKAFSTECK